MKIFQNGRLIDSVDAKISVLDRGFSLGDGIFETLKVSRGQIIGLKLHLSRLRASALVIGLEVPVSDVDLTLALQDVLAANQMENAVLRITLSRGMGERGLLPPANPQPVLIISASPLPPPMGPIAAIISETVRRNEYSPLAQIKSLSYLDNILARQEAARKGADEALLLNTKGQVAEGTIANIFMVKKGEIFTPALKCGILPGVRRAQILAQGAREAVLSLDDLWVADEIFMTNALSVRPIAKLEGREIGTGPVTARFVALCAKE